MRTVLAIAVVSAGGTWAMACSSAPVPSGPATSPGQAPASIRGNPPRVGYLYFGSGPPAYSALTEAFQQGLGELGYVDGQNIVIEYRYAEGRRERLASLVADLVQLPVDVLVLADAVSIPIAQAATETIPIVMAVSGDPVAEGIVGSLARPGKNVTGLSNMSSTLSGKRVELLKEAVPSIARVGVFVNPENPTGTLQLNETIEAARALGVEMQPLSVSRSEDLESVFEAAVTTHVDGLLALPDPVTSRERNRIVAFAAQQGLPGMYGTSEFVQAGGLMAYGPDRRAMFRRAAAYVDRILKGARAGELPIEQPTRFELTLNLRTAEALGLSIPERILLDATAVVR